MDDGDLGGAPVRSPRARWRSRHGPGKGRPAGHTSAQLLGELLNVTSTPAPSRPIPRRRGVLHPMPRIGDAADTAREVLEQFAPEAIEESLHTQRTVEARDRAYRWALAISDVLAVAAALLIMGATGPAN